MVKNFADHHSSQDPSSRARGPILSIQYVWPEPYSSAAGARSLQLLRGLLGLGVEVICASAAQNHEALERLKTEFPQIQFVPILLNDSSFDDWILTLQPSAVVFDRYIIEEQFGARVRAAAPRAARIIDTQDLHFLRAERIRAFSDSKILSRDPSDYQSPETWRELASILRSDLSLCVSRYEIDWLTQQWFIQPSKLEWVPFASELPSPEAPLDWNARKDVVFVGNFRHLPNLDAMRWLKKELWPAIRKRHPDLKLRCAGAYPSVEVSQMNDPKNGFYVQGPIPDLALWLSQARILLAPLRVGAGIKGKILDAWKVGTPVITTPIGAEGFFDSGAESKVGLIAETPEQWVDAIAQLLEGSELWSHLSQSGLERSLVGPFSRAGVEERIHQVVFNLLETMDQRRSRDWFMSILWQENFRSTEYFSRWIEVKNRLIIKT
jgi:glycosyltransferase involved in cell wall biosynthesis